MKRMRWLVGGAMIGVIGAATAVPAAADTRPSHHQPGRNGIEHVLLISVDGLHQSDLAWYVSGHPGSALGRLVSSGTSFTDAWTPFPSDSFPGLVGQVTGGNPRTTGIWYDVSYNRALLPPGTTACGSTPAGATVAYDESIDRVTTSLDAGQGLAGLPGSILGMTSKPQTLIDPAALPVSPQTCKPVYPHSYLRVNTVFEVARQHGLRTAWSDKHPAYEILNGPSGTGVQDLFTPEINSSADPSNPDAQDWTKDNTKTQQYDGFKVQAVLNEIDGYDHSRTSEVGVPGVFGLNFQSVSTAQKLPASGGLPGGYLADGVTPGPVLASALGFVDRQIVALTRELAVRHLAGTTAVVLSAKHGQSPQDGASLTRIDDGAVLGGLDAAWKAAGHTHGLVAGSIDDDGMVMWLTDRSPAALRFARRFLLHYDGTGTGTDGHAKATGIDTAPKAYTASGLRTVLTGRRLLAFTGARANDPRVPDLVGIAQHGTVYTGGTKKIAEHGGDDPQDRHVPLVVSTPDGERDLVDQRVSTVQIAPTILRLLGLDPRELQAVRTERTRALPLR